jgi:hypothetical protein
MEQKLRFLDGTILYSVTPGLSMIFTNPFKSLVSPDESSE